MPVVVTVNSASVLDPTSISDLNQAVAIWNSTFDTSVTMNVTVGFGVDAGTGVPLGNQMQSTGGSTNIAYPLQYAQLRTLLINAVPGFFNDTNLPTAPPSDGIGNPVTNFSVTQTQAKIFGLPINPNTAAIDGLVSIGTGFTPGAQRIGTILHEIGHALGRTTSNFIDGAGVEWYQEFDLFRFLNFNPSQRYFSGVTNPSL